VIIHQSDIKSFNRCAEAHRRQLNGERGKQLSATAFGSVMHHALHTLERHRDLDLALSTFEHYWHPHNIDQICEPVEEWIARQSHGGLRKKGLETIRRYWDLKRFDDEEVLALEVPFVVPIIGTWDADEGRTHFLAGTIDRLSVRHYNRKETVCVDDWKTGKKPSYLKHNLQFSAYAYATTLPDFWVGSAEHMTEGFGLARGAELDARFKKAPRKGWWINVMGGPDWIDAGVRTEWDYKRFAHAAQQYANARKAQIFPLNVDGEVCQYCPFRDNCPEGAQR
jgi:hypothetical protein